MNNEELINNYLKLETQVKDALNRITQNQNNILETMQVYKEQITGKELETKEPLNNSGITLEKVKTIANNYTLLNLNNDDLIVITGVINKLGLNETQINIVFNNVNNYRKNKPINDIKPFLIKSLNKYYNEHNNS